VVKRYKRNTGLSSIVLLNLQYSIFFDGCFYTFVRFSSAALTSLPSFYVLIGRERDHRHSGRTSEEYLRTPQRERSFNGPLASVGDRSVMDHRPANGHQGGSRSTLGLLLLLHHLSVHI